MSELNFEFKNPLIEGIIKKRPNRFIMLVEVDNDLYKCHCPCTGQIGDLVFDTIPCLLSKADNPKRSIAYAVEAISVDYGISYIGINQNAANRYMDFFTNRTAKPYDTGRI